MTSITPHQMGESLGKPNWTALLRIKELWASLAITAMWSAVSITAIWGPNILNHSAGGDESSVPSAVVVALFAFLATWPVAKYGLRDHEGH